MSWLSASQSSVRAPSLPMLDGMVPVSMLAEYLRAERGGERCRVSRPGTRGLALAF